MKYESPMVVELGQVENLTHWKNFGNWDDGLGKWIFSW
jgi:hypothetical protein